MNTTNTSKPVTISPLAEGQMVIIVARFVLVLACLFLILMDAKSTQSVSFNTTRFEIMVVLALAVSNFFLVAQVLTKRKTIDLILYAMSLADLAVISVVIIVQGGFNSGVYTFYFPAMLAFALAFPMLELYLFLGGTIFLYSLICLFTPSLTVDDIQTVLVRLMMLIAVAVCANHFANIERNRRNVLLRNHFAAQQLSQGEAQPASPAMPVPTH